MSVGVAVLGREVTFTMGAAAVAGVMTKNIDLSGSRIETGDDNSAGHAEALAKSGEDSGSITIEGLVKNYNLFASWFTNASRIYAFVFTFPDGSTLTQDYYMDTLSTGMPYAEGSTYSAGFSTSGAPVWVSGT